MTPCDCQRAFQLLYGRHSLPCLKTVAAKFGPFGDQSGRRMFGFCQIAKPLACTLFKKKKEKKTVLG